LIGWGIGLVLRRTPGELLGSAISVILLGVMVGGLISTGFGGVSAVGCGDTDRGGGTSFGNRSGTLEASGRVGIEFNCGVLKIGAVDGSDWSISGTGPDGRGPDIDADFDSVTIAPRDVEFGFFEDGSEWNIDLPRDSRIDLGITLNAGEGTVDLAGASLDGLSLTINAGSIDFGLADASLASVSATVNAGSATFDLPGSVESASMTLNAGSVEVCVPAGTPLRVSWSGALASNNFDAAGLDKIDDEHWQTPGFTGDALDFSVSANAGSFSLDLGGACDA
jgi:hypothetical protein